VAGPGVAGNPQGPTLGCAGELPDLGGDRAQQLEYNAALPVDLGWIGTHAGDQAPLDRAHTLACIAADRVGCDSIVLVASTAVDAGAARPDPRGAVQP